MNWNLLKHSTSAEQRQDTPDKTRRGLGVALLLTTSLSWMLTLTTNPAPAHAAPVNAPTAGTTPALGDVIFNEYATDGDDFIELLVLAPNLDLRGVRITDNELMTGTLTTGESVYTLDDSPYLASVPSGTTIGIWRVATTTVDTNVNAAANDWSLLLAPGTGIITGTDGLGGANNTTLATGNESIYLYLPGPNGDSTGTDNVYLDFIAWEGGDGAQAPAGLTYINLPSVADNAYYTGITAAGNDVVGNWVRYNGAPTASTTPGQPNPGQDLSSLRVGDFYPAVNSTSPTNNATDVIASQPLVFTFNKPVTAGANAFAIACNGAPVAVSTVSGSPGSIISVTHAAFPVSAACTATALAAHISDVDANDPPDAPQADYTLNFTSAGVDNPPTIIAHSPANGATEVSVKSNVVITFSEPVAVSGAWFEIVCGTSGVRGLTQTIKSGGPTVFTINPRADFSPNETCTTTVFGAQVKDQDNTADPMAADVSFSFTISTSTSVPNVAPTANAGADVTATLGSAVQLNGSASTDADGDVPLSYAWTQVAGTPVNLSGANTAMPSFTAPSTVGALSFALVVTDALGAVSAADTVVVNVVPQTDQPDQPITGLAVSGPMTRTTGTDGVFTATIAAGDNVTYLWLVNGETAGTGPTLTQTFVLAGTYQVTVIAQNDTGTQQVSQTVVVSNAPTNTSLVPKAYLPLLNR